MMVQFTQMPTFPVFDIDGDPASLATCWNKWLECFDNFLVAMHINEPCRSKAMLLHVAGERVYDIYAALPEGEAKDDDQPAQNQ